MRRFDRRLGQIFGAFIRFLTWLIPFHPKAKALLVGLKIAQNQRYSDRDPRCQLDVYRKEGLEGPLPAVVYLHGGGFYLGSKESHSLFAARWAQAGYAVFIINYRLAPEHPYPAAIEDAMAAVDWVKREGGSFGADPERIVVAGDSAGGNLALSVALADSHRFSMPAAEAFFDAGPHLKGVFPACGLLQVSDPGRYVGRQSRLIQGRLRAMCMAYMGDPALREPLLDPICFLESEQPLDRAFPPVFGIGATRDWILEDTQRLEAVLKAREIPGEVRYYRGIHVFHGTIWWPESQKAWSEQLAFAAPLVSPRLPAA